MKPEDFVVGREYFYTIEGLGVWSNVIYICTHIDDNQIKIYRASYNRNRPAHIRLLARYVPASSLLKELF